MDFVPEHVKSNGQSAFFLVVPECSPEEDLVGTCACVCSFTFEKKVEEKISLSRKECTYHRQVLGFGLCVCVFVCLCVCVSV